jgi:alkanesulfonate monooxygenase SsuD/methylene tetrahydromethanopterin reductase-like flavin-dependent oxidoreductase (luciferase family)
VEPPTEAHRRLAPGDTPSVDLGIHLPLMPFGGEGLSLARLERAVDAARECGFAAVSANDHFVFSTPWLDGPTALASVIGRTGDMTLATTISLAVLRGPVPLAKTLAALDVLSGGRLIAGLGPGSSKRDYDALGVPFDERWKRFDESIARLRALLQGGTDVELAPAPLRPGGIPLWIGSWGSEAGLRRVVRSGDGWLASAYNTTPERFAEARSRLPEGFPNALATMWTWVAEDRAEADRVLGEVLAPRLNRDPKELRAQLCIGPAEHCAELLARYAEAGCQRVFLWPLGDEQRQIELVANAAGRLTARGRSGR